MTLRRLLRQHPWLTATLVAVCILLVIGAVILSKIDKTRIGELTQQQKEGLRGANTTSELYEALDSVSPDWHSLSIAFPYESMFSVWSKLGRLWTPYLDSWTMRSDGSHIFMFLDMAGNLSAVHVSRGVIDVDRTLGDRRGPFSRADRDLGVRIVADRKMLVIEERQ